MLSQKMKECAGFDGVSHKAYIYKNIDGKKYCKACALKLQPPKAIPKRTEKQMFKLKFKKDLLEEDKKFYLSIWEERTQGDPGMDIMLYYPICECCGKNLGSEPNLMYFHHILEKRNYPKFRHVKTNIAILCPDCHHQYEIMPDKVPSLVKRRKTLLDLYENIEDLFKQNKNQ